MTDRPRRPARPQIELEVLSTRRLSPHLVRLVLGGEGFARFTPNAFTDRYVKIFFSPSGEELHPPFDVAELRATLPADRVPVTRTYTVREVNEAEGWLAVDFVVHGDEGLAGPWAASAVPGDHVVLTGPGGGYAPDPTADWHLLVGDESALPAIAAALEALPDDAEGDAFVEVAGPEDEVPLTVPAGVALRWVHRGPDVSGTPRLLADAVAAAPWRDGRVHAFVHGERESVKALRDVMLYQRGVAREHLSISGYWARGRAEDRFQAEKREPIGQILP
ncbi:siderophore-interacting protein [Luteimicrobium album]|uniref:Siderophore-interacting protein n=1 Tax=Luteimicrobium album TaxID=1054550 RepID=A0ABQ6I0Q9_9MICO|nr:siderophore-interacting protein [Luteimicrobium album]GMA24207.1 siderophore-interacting protein [Luteimicrobium album]